MLAETSVTIPGSNRTLLLPPVPHQRQDTLQTRIAFLCTPENGVLHRTPTILPAPLQQCPLCGTATHQQTLVKVHDT